MLSVLSRLLKPPRKSLLPKAKEWFEAAEQGDEKVVGEILNESTAYLWEEEALSDRIAFHIAVENGRENVVAQLLAVDPRFIDAVDCEKRIALHIAAANGHDKVLDQLLAANQLYHKNYWAFWPNCSALCGLGRSRESRRQTAGCMSRLDRRAGVWGANRLARRSF